MAQPGRMPPGAPSALHPPVEVSDERPYVDLKIDLSSRRTARLAVRLEPATSPSLIAEARTVSKPRDRSTTPKHIVGGPRCNGTASRAALTKQHGSEILRSRSRRSEIQRSCSMDYMITRACRPPISRLFGRPCRRHRRRCRRHRCPRRRHDDRRGARPPALSSKQVSPRPTPSNTARRSAEGGMSSAVPLATALQCFVDRKGRGSCPVRISRLTWWTVMSACCRACIGSCVRPVLRRVAFRRPRISGQP